MMDILLKTAIQAEITRVPVIQEIMPHHQEIILTVTMVTPVHVMTIQQETIVTEMAMDGVVTIQMTAAHVTDMVEVETVTQAAEVIATQVVVIGLADKNKGFPFYGKGVPSAT
jgi:hypothetical protein